MLTDCPGCGAKHPPDLAVCPQCGHGGDEMPKTTRLGGASNAALDVPDPAPPAEPVPAPAPEPVEPDDAPEGTGDEAGGPEAEPAPASAAKSSRTRKAKP